MRQDRRHGYRRDHRSGEAYHVPQRRDDPLDAIWRYHRSITSDEEKQRQSEKPLRDWFAIDHNSNGAIERKVDGLPSTVAKEYQKIYGASDRRGTRNDEFDRRGDSRDRTRERPYERGGYERRGYEPPRVVVVRSRGAPAPNRNASNPPPPMEAPPADPPPPPPVQPVPAPPPRRREGFSNPPPPAKTGGGSAWDRGRAPDPAAAPMYPSAAARPSAAPMGSRAYGGAARSMASTTPLSSPYASHGGARGPPPPLARRENTHVRSSRYDAYDTDRDDDSDTDPDEDRRRRESLARDPSRRLRDAPSEPVSEVAWRRCSGSESLSRHDSSGKRGSRGAPAVSRALPKAALTGTHAASRVSGILNAIPGPGRLTVPKPMMPVGTAAAPRVKDTSFEERARALADEKKRKAAEAEAAEAAEAEAQHAARKRARLAKEAKEAKQATRMIAKPEPGTIVVASEDVPDEDVLDDKLQVTVHNDDDSDSEVVLDKDEDDDDEARREANRAAKKLKKDKKLKKKASDASAESAKGAAENSVEGRQAPPIQPLGGEVPKNTPGIIHNVKYPAYYFLARDVYVQKLFRANGSTKDTPDLSIRRFHVSDDEPMEVEFENTDVKGNPAKTSVKILRSFLALFRWAAREWGRDSDDIKLFFQEYGADKKQFKDVMNGKD